MEAFYSVISALDKDDYPFDRLRISPVRKWTQSFLPRLNFDGDELRNAGPFLKKGIENVYCAISSDAKKAALFLFKFRA